MAKQKDNLLAEIEAKVKEIHTDAYPMSIGELMSIYCEDELDIHPEFQRFFRWTDLQKSKFIESILLGIPIPSIFVSQRDDGVWDVVDGVQRLSTIFEFLGVLKDKEAKKKDPSRLIETEYLPSLDGKVWQDDKNPESSFSSSLRLDFKRKKIDLKIIKKESDESTKYDLFERLNTLGSHLSDQELRNCLLVMINPGFYEWLEKLSTCEGFQKALSLTDRSIQERYDMDLLLRFLILIREPQKELSRARDIGEFITQRMRVMASDKKFDTDRAGKVVRRTFDLLVKSLGEQCFVRRSKGRGRGGFLLSVFEVLAVGLGSMIHQNLNRRFDTSTIEKVADNLQKNTTFQDYAKSGRSAKTRLPALVPLGRRLFKA